MRKGSQLDDVEPTVDFENLLDPGEHRAKLADELRIGLTSPEKRVSPMWFYDEIGSNLFDEITRLPEYYLTRTEHGILGSHAASIAERTQADTLVELGSGTSQKTTILLDAMRDGGRLRRFVPLDVSEETLVAAAKVLRARYPRLSIYGVIGDFQRHLGALPSDGRRMVAFLGSTIGNLDPAQRGRFLRDLESSLWTRDWLLLGTDLVKDPDELVAAYDDAAGVTAAFNKNLLRVLNDEFGATFDPAAFDHVARWNDEQRWIEMRLRSTVDQRVRIGALDLEIRFTRGEELWTEISAKFSPEQVRSELWDAGFVTEETFSDPDGRYLLTLARPYC